MSTPTSLARPALRLALGIAGTGLAALGIVFANAEALVESRFERALAAKSRGATETPAPAFAGSEEFWLKGERAAGTQPVAWSKTVAVGDRFTIGSGGAERLLEVVDIRELPGVTPTADTGSRKARLQLVTCRDVGKSDTRPIRILIDAGEPLVPPSSAKPAHAL